MNIAVNIASCPHAGTTICSVEKKKGKAISDPSSFYGAVENFSPSFIAPYAECRGKYLAAISRLLGPRFAADSA